MREWIGKPEFAAWVGNACRLIRFTPDRERVKAEMLEHMEDSYDACLDAGLESREAIARVVERMGDADAVAEQLQKVYRPFWGYVWKWTRVLAVIAVIYMAWNLAVIPAFELVGMLVNGEDLWYSQDNMADYVHPPYDSDSTVISDFTPQDTAEAEGYKISIARICFREADSGYRSAYFVLRVSNWNPWLRNPMFIRNLYAVDDRGNVYPPRDETNVGGREVTGNGPIGNDFVGNFVSYYEMWIADVDPEATSFTLGFDDYGVSWELSFPVEGGIEYAQE